MSGCSRPVLAVRQPDGAVSFISRLDVRRTAHLLRLRCGRCPGCRMATGRMWSIRCLHESLSHYCSSFVTLTLADDLLAERLDHGLFQLFVKRLRKRVGELRYFMCGEYGELYGRAHYHAILFGVDHQALVEESWKLGHVRSDDVTPASISYVTGYVTKASSEPFGKPRPYRKMSRRPALGLRYFERFKGDFEGGSAVWGGMETSLPPFYRKKLDPEVLERLTMDSVQREAKIPLEELIDSRSPQRRASREAIAQAKIDQSWRDFE